MYPPPAWQDHQPIHGQLPARVTTISLKKKAPRQETRETTRVRRNRRRFHHGRIHPISFLANTYPATHLPRAMGSSRGSLPPLHRTRLRLATSPAANIPAQDNRKHANLMAWAAPMSPLMPPAATLLALSNPATTLLKQLPRTSNPRSRVPQAHKASSLSRPPHLLTVRLTRQQPTKITPRRCMAKTVCPTQRALALHIRLSRQTQLRRNSPPGTATPHFQTWQWGLPCVNASQGVTPFTFRQAPHKHSDTDHCDTNRSGLH